MTAAWNRRRSFFIPFFFSFQKPRKFDYQQLSNFSPSFLILIGTSPLQMDGTCLSTKEIFESKDFHCRKVSGERSLFFWKRLFFFYTSLFLRSDSFFIRVSTVQTLSSLVEVLFIWQTKKCKRRRMDLKHSSIREVFPFSSDLFGSFFP